MSCYRLRVSKQNIIITHFIVRRPPVGKDGDIMTNSPVRPSACYSVAGDPCSCSALANDATIFIAISSTDVEIIHVHISYVHTVR